MSVVVKKGRPRLTGSKGSFSDAVDYALREGRHKDKERPLDVFAVNVASLQTAAAEMEATAAQSAVRKDPIYHVIVSWDRGEYPTSEEARQAAAIVAEQLGMERHQYVASLQTDGKAGLYHLHIIFNRVDPVALRSWDEKLDYPKLNAAAHAIVEEQGWSPIRYEYGGNRTTAGLSRGARDAEYRDAVRAFQSRVRDDLAPIVRAGLADKTLTWATLHDELRSRDARYVMTDKGARIEGRASGQYAGAAKYLGVSHRDLVAALGPYIPDRHAGRSFEDRVHSATLEVRALRKQSGATWADVHKAFDTRGLRYDRYGGGARIYDRDSPAFVKAADVDPALRFGRMTKAFGEFRAALSANERVAQQDVVDRAENLVIGQQYLNDPRPIIETLTRNDSTFTVSRLYSEIGKRVRDEQQQHEIAERIASESVILEDSNGSRRFTTAAILAEELALVHVARSLATSRVDEITPSRVASGTLDAQQSEGYRRSICDRQLVMVTGVPGSGKTHLLDEVAAAWREKGYRVRGVSVANKAVRVMNDETSFSSRTVAKELYEWSQGRDRLTNRDVLIIDEISMLDSAQGKMLLEEAARVGAVVRAYGDDRQFSAVGRGDAMRAIHDEIERAGYSVYDMKETRRQRLDETDLDPGWMRQATRDIREGRIREGLDAYRNRGFVEGYNDRMTAAERLVSHWERDTEAGYDVGLAAYRRDDVALLNDLARRVARDRGELVGPDHELDTAYGTRTFAEGDRVVVRQTVFGDRDSDGLRERWSNGDEARVSRIDGTTVHLVRDRDGARIAMDLSRDNQLDHAYASTKHRGQGSTHERQLVFVSRADDARSTLVGMTRHQEQLRVVFAGEDFRRGYESVVQLAERTRVKEMSTDYEVVGFGRDVRGGREEKAATLDRSISTPTNERTHEMPISSYVPDHLRDELARSGLTYDQWLNRQYAFGAQGIQQQQTMYATDDSRAYLPVESDSGCLSNYNTERNRDGSVTYRDENGARSFTDQGSSIVVHAATEKNIGAAVELAKGKYGDQPIYVVGSEKFKEQVLRECVRQGVHVANPELRDLQQKLQQEHARSEGRVSDDPVREPSRNDLVRHATLKDWERFYGPGHEALARETYEETRKEIAARDVAFYQRTGYTRDQAEAQYHNARQSFDLPRDRELESRDLSSSRRVEGASPRSADRGVEAFAKAKDRTVREPEHGARVAGTVAYAKDRGDGTSTVLIADKNRPYEYSRVDVPTGQAQALKIGDQIQVTATREIGERARANAVERVTEQAVQQREIEREQQQR